MMTMIGIIGSIRGEGKSWKSYTREGLWVPIKLITFIGLVSQINFVLP